MSKNISNQKLPIQGREYQPNDEYGDNGTISEKTMGDRPYAS